ncbi:hypothetical protein N7461_006111 [Penicillium sp. DV-2018c]|nr:hypothetical protein N7461_006111 [Penicillium sp. DV-2018c]
MSYETFASTLPSRIASLVHAHFEALPARNKPRIHSDDVREHSEWIPMTGIVAVKGENTALENLTCISVTSGAKCLSASHIPRCKGLVLHDCHAEILAIRAFNYWLLTECRSVLSREKRLSNGDGTFSSDYHEIADSPFIQRRSIQEYEDASTSPTKWPPFALRPDIKIYMYCTCAPCGDASMELCMAAQEDATPWEVSRQEGTPSVDAEGPPTTETLLDGRAHFSRLGVVRRKPARMDAESTRSKSCSDKLALRQVSSLLSCETSRLVAPTENAYLAGLILPEDEISRVGFDRSFGENGRMKALKGRTWPVDTKAAERIPGYQFRPFEVLSVPSEEIAAVWRFGKPKALPRNASASVANAKKSRPGNVSAVWTVAPSYQDPSTVLVDTGSKALPNLCRSRTGLHETIINGVKQGNRASSPRARGASALSRAKLWALFRDVVSVADAHIDHNAPLSVTSLSNASGVEELDANESQRLAPGPVTYREFKEPSSSQDPLQIRIQAIGDAKAVLQGWIPNTGDEDWSLDDLVDSKKRKL